MYYIHTYTSIWYDTLQSSVLTFWKHEISGTPSHQTGPFEIVLQAPPVLLEVQVGSQKCNPWTGQNVQRCANDARYLIKRESFKIHKKWYQKWVFSSWNFFWGGKEWKEEIRGIKSSFNGWSGRSCDYLATTSVSIYDAEGPSDFCNVRPMKTCIDSTLICMYV